MNAKASPSNTENAAPAGQPQHPISVQISSQYSVADLQAEWCELLGRADHSFFLSWAWTSTWLTSLPPDVRPQLMRARSGDRTVGLALLGTRQATRHGFIRSRGLHLNCTGDDAFDDITIEYNALLIDKASHVSVQSAMLAHVVNEHRSWDELHLPGMTHVAPELSAVPNTRLRQRTSTSFQVQLDSLGMSASGAASVGPEPWATDADADADVGNAGSARNPGPTGPTGTVSTSASASTVAGKDIEDYLEVLGQKPRYHIRRSLRQYALLGPLSLQAAQTLEQAHAIMGELQALHSAYWASKGRLGAFLNPYVISFHQQLINAAFASGQVQLLRLSAGDKVISCMYNFVYQGKVYHYQSGINYTLFDGQDSPGLVSHAMAVSLNAAAGHSVYDFMAGDQQYKRSLCTDTGELHWLVLQRARLQFNVEDLLRRAKRRFVPRSLA